MTIKTREFARAERDGLFATGAVTLMGVGTFLIFASLFTANFPMAITGAGAAALALLMLFTSGWLSMLPLLAVSLALPPAYASDAVRLGPALLVTVMVVVAWTLKSGVEGRSLDVGRLPVALLALFVTWLVISAGFAADRGSAARETLNLLLFVTLLFAATDLFTGAAARVKKVAVLLGWAAAAAGAFGIAQTLGIAPGTFPLMNTGLFRATGGFGWPNELAMYLAISLPFSVYLLQVAPTRSGKMVALLGVGLTLAGLGATFSRGSWIATLVAPGVLFLVGERRFALRVWFAVALAAVGLDLASGGAISGRVAQTLVDPLVGQRFLLTRAGVLMFIAHPLVGVGPGGFEAGLDEFGLLVPGLYDFVGSAHNAYVHVAAELGILGLVSFTGFLASTWWVLLGRAKRLRDKSPERAQLAVTILWAFTTACLISFAEWTLAHGVAQLIMLVAAMGCTRPEEPAA